jgi:hypothetical protein
MMNSSISAAAAQFASEYFTDDNLGQEQFNVLIEQALNGFIIMEDKVDFLSEVIRLGHLFLNESQSVLSRMEEQDLSRAGIKSLF